MHAFTTPLSSSSSSSYIVRHDACHMNGIDGKNKFEKKIIYNKSRVPGVVLVIDNDLFTMNTNVGKTTLLELINNNATVLWTTKVSYNTRTNEVASIAQYYKMQNINFSAVINGLKGKMKSMHYFRKRFACSQWLGYPMCIIDTDVHSVIDGGWDFGCLISDYIVQHEMTKENVLDVRRIILDVNKFIDSWASTSTADANDDASNVAV